MELFRAGGNEPGLDRCKEIIKGDQKYEKKMDSRIDGDDHISDDGSSAGSAYGSGCTGDAGERCALWGDNYRG